MNTKALKVFFAKCFGLFATLPFRFIKHDIAPPKNIEHGKWPAHLQSLYNKPGMRVLELGSRVVTGSNFRTHFSEADYVGFDFYEGENVDVVGDAHKLASYFNPDEKFDLIFSSAVFEHLHMPWIVAEQIQKLLKTGGMVFVETHFSFSSHERPWNFFQFSEMGLRALFNRALGFELIEFGMSNPMGGYFAAGASKCLKYLPVRELYCHSEILVRKVDEPSRFSWSDVDIDEIVDETRYPAPTR